MQTKLHTDHADLTSVYGDLAEQRYGYEREELNEASPVACSEMMKYIA